MFVKKKFVPQIRNTSDADHRGRKSMRLLGHEVLRAMILAHGKTGHACAGRGQRIETRSVTEHVAEVQAVGRRKIMVEPYSELIGVILQSLSGLKYVGAAVGQW